MISESAGDGLRVRILSEEGDAIEEALRLSAAEKADLVLASPRYKALAKKASCPVYIMPGLILGPVDNSEVLLPDRETILLLPAGGKTPSELAKAASILLDEPERVRLPIELMQTAEA